METQADYLIAPVYRDVWYDIVNQVRTYGYVAPMVANPALSELESLGLIEVGASWGSWHSITLTGLGKQVMRSTV